MSTVPASPAVRHGTCKLRIYINSDQYTIKRHRGQGPYCRVWELVKRTGPRAGTSYLTGRCFGILACSCDDMSFRKPAGGCKHIKALVALGLVSGRRPAKGGA
jgi:hypothetical protein